jgi:hypothetical protein
MYSNEYTVPLFLKVCLWSKLFGNESGTFLNAADYKYACYSEAFQVHGSRLKGKDRVQMKSDLFPLNYLYSYGFRVVPLRQFIYSLYKYIYYVFVTLTKIKSHLVTIIKGTKLLY